MPRIIGYQIQLVYMNEFAFTMFPVAQENMQWAQKKEESSICFSSLPLPSICYPESLKIEKLALTL